jgi:hypothetical protein
VSAALRLCAPGLAGPFGAALDRALDPLEEREFEDGERKAGPMTDVPGTDAYVIRGLHGDAQAGPERRLIRLLFLISTLRDHGAARVTALIPSLAYARKDRRTKARDPRRRPMSPACWRPRAPIAWRRWSPTTAPPSRPPSASRPCPSIVAA